MKQKFFGSAIMAWVLLDRFTFLQSAAIIIGVMLIVEGASE